MAFPLTLLQHEYESLIELARQGTLNPDGSVNQSKALSLDSFLRALETRNGVTRYFIWVQWQEQNQPLPPTTDFPAKWPPEMRQPLALVTRPIARADVDALLKVKAKSPTSVLVTRDPAGLVGWTELDVFFK